MAVPIPFGPVLQEPEGTSMERGSLADEGLSLILAQLAGKPRFEALIAGLADAVQDVDDATWQLYTERWIDTAVGVQLDGLGSVVGQARAGRTDEVFRAFIRARVLVLRSNATWKALLSVLAALDVEMASVVYLPDHPAAFVARLDDALPASITGRDIFEMLEEAKAGGVRLLLEHPAVGADAAASFRYEAPEVATTAAILTAAGDTLTTTSGDALVANIEVAVAGAEGAGYGSSNDPATGGVYGGAHASSEVI